MRPFFSSSTCASSIITRYQHLTNIDFLRSVDQSYLLQHRDLIEQYIAHLRKCQTLFDSMPAIVQELPEIESIPAFTIGRVRRARTKTDAAIQQAQHTREHLVDLQFEPFPNLSVSPLEEYEAKVKEMTATERETELQHVENQLAVADRDEDDAVATMLRLLDENLGVEFVNHHFREKLKGRSDMGWETFTDVGYEDSAFGTFGDVDDVPTAVTEPEGSTETRCVDTSAPEKGRDHGTIIEGGKEKEDFIRVRSAFGLDVQVPSARKAGKVKDTAPQKKKAMRKQIDAVQTITERKRKGRGRNRRSREAESAKMDQMEKMEKMVRDIQLQVAQLAGSK